MYKARNNLKQKVVRQGNFCHVHLAILATYAITIARATATKPTLPLATTCPAPELPEPPEELPDDPLEAGALAVTVAAGAAVASASTPPVTGPLSVSVCSELPIAMAAAWNAWNVLVPLVGALIEPTIPIPQ